MNLIPLSIALALSIRSSNIENTPFDVQLSAESTWHRIEIIVEFERENGQRFLDYSFVFEDTLSGSWLIEANSRVKGALNIDFQSVVIGYDGLLLNLGGGMVTHHYRTPVKAVYSFGIPLPRGELKLITDFKRVHIWKGSSLVYFAENEDVIRPYVEANGISENGKLNYQFKVGIEVIFK